MANEFKLEVVLKGVDQLSPTIKGATEKVDKLAASMDKLNKLSGGLKTAGQNMAVAGVAIGAAVGSTLIAFADLEQAQVQLRNAFADPKSLKYFDEINKQAIKAGDIYPGTSADFLNLAASMKMAGADAETMASGGFKAAAALQVMFQIPPSEAGAFFQEMSNSMGIAGKDAAAFADQIQRVRYASGLSVSGIHDALKYAGAPMKSLGIQGQGQSALVLATMGALKKGGLGDEQVGSAMGQFLDKLAIARARLTAGDSRGAAMKAAFGELDQSGVKLNFFDEKGGFLGLANALGQVSQVSKMNDAARSLVGKGLFGVQGSRVLSAASMDQVNIMLQRMREQEELQTRLARITGTLGNRWESLKGTATNALAAIGEKMAPVLVPLLDKLNGIVEKVRIWIDQNPKIAAGVGLAAAGLAAFLVAGGGALWVVGKLMGAFVAIQPILTGFTVKSLIAMWPVAALAAAGYLMYKHWDTVGPVIKGVGENLGIVFGSLGDVFGLMSGKAGEFDQFNDKLRATEIIATVLAKALGTVAYGLVTIFAVLKGDVEILKGIGEAPGAMLKSMLSGGSAPEQLWAGAKAVGGGIRKGYHGGLDIMQKARNPFEGDLDYFAPTRRAAASVGNPVQVTGGVTINVDGAKDPKATADAVEQVFRERMLKFMTAGNKELAADARGAF